MRPYEFDIVCDPFVAVMIQKLSGRGVVLRSDGSLCIYMRHRVYIIMLSVLSAGVTLVYNVDLEHCKYRASIILYI